MNGNDPMDEIRDALNGVSDAVRGSAQQPQDAFEIGGMAASESVVVDDLEFQMPTVDESESESDGKPRKEAKRSSLSHSAAAAFRQCARLFKHRYIDKIESVDREEALWLGGLYSDAHECRTKLIAAGASEEVAIELTSMYLDHAMEGWETEPKKRRIRIVCEAMFRANISRWTAANPRDATDIGKMDSDFDVVAAEPYYRIRPRNPMTGAVSRTFDAPLLVDRLLRRKDSGKLWIHERKTASSIEDIVDWVWTDVQTRLYSKWISETLGEPVEGVLYDVAAKPLHRQTEAFTESDEVWTLRVQQKIEESYASLTEKKKRVPTLEEKSADEIRVRNLKTMQRKVVEAETNESFFARVFAACDKVESQVRYWHMVDDVEIEDAMLDYWDITQQIIEARKRGRWPKNTMSCRKWGSPCEFVPLCKGSMRVESLNFAQQGSALESNHEFSLYRPRQRSGGDRRVERWILSRVSNGRPIHLGRDKVISSLTIDDVGRSKWTTAAAEQSSTQTE